MCITKSKNNIKTVFDKHVIEELDFETVSQKSSHWYTDITTKKVFMELDAERTV